MAPPQFMYNPNARIPHGTPGPGPGPGQGQGPGLNGHGQHHMNHPHHPGPGQGQGPPPQFYNPNMTPQHTPHCKFPLPPVIYLQVVELMG
jgi:hypothetical protein